MDRALLFAEKSCHASRSVLLRKERDCHAVDRALLFAEKTCHASGSVLLRKERGCHVVDRALWAMVVDDSLERRERRSAQCDAVCAIWKKVYICRRIGEIDDASIR